MRPLLVLAGTFAPQRVCGRYYASLYPTRVVALPDGGRNRLSRTYTALLPEIEQWALDQDEAVVVAGHSQGAIHALTFALDHPHLVDNVVCIAGPFNGANAPAIVPNLIPFVERVLPIGLDFQRGSEYLTALQERASTSSVPITLVAGANDMLVAPESALAISPADKVLHAGGHTSVMHQRETKHLLRVLRERQRP